MDIRYAALRDRDGLIPGASLRQLGPHRATDLIGGFQAWRGAGLPVTPT